MGEKCLEQPRRLAPSNASRARGTRLLRGGQGRRGDGAGGKGALELLCAPDLTWTERPVACWPQSSLPMERRARARATASRERAMGLRRAARAPSSQGSRQASGLTIAQDAAPRLVVGIPDAASGAVLSTGVIAACWCASWWPSSHEGGAAYEW